MAKRKKVSEPEIIEGFVERNIETPPSSGGTSRITIHVNEDNSIDWDKSQAGTSDELLAAVTNDPTMLEKIAASPDFKDSEESSKVTPEEGGLVLDAITMVEGIIFSSISKKMLGMKVDSKVVQENFKLTESEHTRQDPLAAQGLQMLLEALELDPRYKWAYLLVMAHSASVIRASKNSIMAQFDIKDNLTPPNPATQSPEENK